MPDLERGGVVVNFSIKVRLYGLIALMLLLIGLVASFGLYGARVSDDGLDSVYTNQLVPLRDLMGVSDSYARMIFTIRRMQAGDLALDEGVRGLQQVTALKRQWWQRYLSARMVREEKVIAAEILPLMKTADEGVERFVTLARGGDRSSVASASLEPLRAVVITVTGKLTALADLQLQVAKSEYEKCSQTYHELRRYAKAAVVLALVIALVGGGVVVRSITLPLAEVSRIAGRVAEGDLDVCVEFPSSSEVGQVMTAMQRMLVRLRKTINDNQEKNCQLQATNREISDLSSMAQFLQTCTTMEEAGAVLDRFGARLFPGDLGGVYLLNQSKTVLFDVARWGEGHGDVFSPEQCWALRLGQLHVVSEAGDVACAHLEKCAEASICVPLAAQNETMGTLHLALTAPVGADEVARKQALAMKYAEHVALALRNLQLRERLRELSIRDSLTGLLNRRYMDEALQREVARALRKGLPLSVIIMDIDHFKSFNDRFGHEAGDEVLRAVGQVLNTELRSSDIVCRFGGEEFVAILPEVAHEAARAKAEALRCAVKRVRLYFAKQHLGPIAISAGVATLPDVASTGGDLIGRADAALYRAKENGRDQVCSAAARGDYSLHGDNAPLSPAVTDPPFV